MKEVANKKSGMTVHVRGIVSSLVVIAIVLAYPAFSLLQVGNFFHKSDSRSSAALPVMTQRKVDTTTLTPQLFQEPLVSVTFDDGFESIYKTALPLLQKYGIHSTQYIIAGKFDDPFYVSESQVAQMQRGGHEIACHTMTHTDLTTLDDAGLEYQLGQCKSILTKDFGIISDFASPYGAADEHTNAVTAKYFDSQRNTNGDPTNGVSNLDVNVEDGFQRFNIIGVTVRHDTTIKELQDLVKFARANNGWLVLTYHQADDANSSQFAVDPAQLEKQLAYLSSTNVRIVTVHEALQATKLSNVEF